MKHLFHAIFATLLLLVLTAESREVRRTRSCPCLKILSVAIPSANTNSLVVHLRLTVAQGNEPVAVSADWLTINISKPDDEWTMLFDGHAAFVGMTNSTVVISPSCTNDVKLTTNADRFTGRRWADLPSGRYRMRVYLNSSKTPDYDYQWLGQTYSPGYDFELK